MREELMARLIAEMVFPILVSCIRSLESLSLSLSVGSTVLLSIFFLTEQGLRKNNTGRAARKVKTLWEREREKRRMWYQRLSGPFTEWRDLGL